jgi:hypothetical protein
MYSVAKQIYKELDKFKKDITLGMEQPELLTYLNSETFKELKEKRYKQLREEFKTIARIEIDIRRDYKAVCEEQGLKNQDKLLDEDNLSHNNKGNIVKPYLITIRPKNQSLDTGEFIPKIEKYIKRKMFDKSKDISYSLEQKCGPDDPNLGHGIHTHIIAYTDIPKSDLVSNTISTFNKLCEPQGVHIKPINDIGIALKYITGENKGGKNKEEIALKKLHSEGDKVWREKWNLETLYTYTGGETSTSSPPLIEINNNTQVITF